MMFRAINSLWERVRTEWYSVSLVSVTVFDPQDQGHIRRVRV
jgi:hypothetical protein